MQLKFFKFTNSSNSYHGLFHEFNTWFTTNKTLILLTELTPWNRESFLRRQPLLG